jgi:hypothetical protein
LANGQASAQPSDIRSRGPCPPRIPHPEDPAVAHRFVARSAADVCPRKPILYTRAAASAAVAVLLRVEEVLSHLPSPPTSESLQALQQLPRSGFSCRSSSCIDTYLRRDRDRPRTSLLHNGSYRCRSSTYCTRVNRVVRRLMPELTRAEREAFNVREQDNDERHGPTRRFERVIRRRR